MRSTSCMAGAGLSNRPKTRTSASVSAICPRAPRPRLYDRSGLPHSELLGSGGRGNRSKTVTLVYPRRASTREAKRPAGPAPTMAVFLGRAARECGVRRKSDGFDRSPKSVIPVCLPRSAAVDDVVTPAAIRSVDDWSEGMRGRAATTKLKAGPVRATGSVGCNGNGTRKAVALRTTSKARRKAAPSRGGAIVPSA